ncbi:MAG: hypothetical protein J6Q53_04800 [Oscillospiraceae bacterium]|nr:hypothetical protein [Oscillospiraceae bacterium]
MANKWRYECDCSKCSQIQYISDPEHHREGNYCTAVLDGKKTIHADDDYVIRCDCYAPRFHQTSIFDSK